MLILFRVVRLSVCSCVQRKVPPVLFYTSTLEYFSTTTHTQIYGEFTHILLRNLEHTENSYRFFSSDLGFEKLITTTFAFDTDFKASNVSFKSASIGSAASLNSEEVESVRSAE